MANSPVQLVRDSAGTGAYRFTEHAEREREADTIPMTEIEEAFGGARLELIEDYPDDPRGQSALLLGFTASGSPLHAVVGLSNPNLVVFVTVYRPRAELRYDWRIRVKE